MYYVITRDDSVLIGVTRDNPYSMNLPNVSIHEMGLPIPDLNQYHWDFVLGDFVRNEDATTYTRLQFISKFTLAERVAITASNDPIVRDIMKMFDMATYIDIARTDTIQSVHYLASVGLIQPSRIAEILT